MRRTIPFLLALFILPSLMHAQWLPLTGPYGGMVQALGGTSGGALLAAMYDGPLYISTNNGSTWNTAADETWTGSVNLFALAPDGTVYAGASQRGLYRSTDGRSWQKTAFDDVPSSIAFTADGDLLVGGRGRIHRSDDGGDNWSSVEPIPGTTRMYRVAVAADGSWLAGAYREGVTRSTDGGASWTDIGTALPNDEVYSISMIDGTTLFAGLNNTTYRSTDLGQSWEEAGGLQNSNVYNVERLDAARLGAESSAGLFLSSDNGRTWARIATDDIDRRFFALHVGDAGLLIAATDGRLKRSTNGGDSWSISDRGIHAGPVHALCFPGNGDYLVGTWFAGIHRSTDAGANWVLTDSVFIPFATAQLLAAENGDVYAVTLDYDILRSTDGGMYWMQSAAVSDSSTAETMAEIEGALLAADNNGTVFRSTDQGGSWAGISVITPVSGKVSRVELITDVSVSTIVYAATDRGFFKSTDAGNSWSAHLVDGINRNLTTVHQAPDGTLYCAAVRNLYRSADGGESWTMVFESPGLPWIGQIASNRQSNVYVTDDQGVSYSEDGTGGWTNVLFPEHISVMAMDRNDFLVIGTEHQGLFRSNETTVGTDPLTFVPLGLRIDGVYPQPMRADGSAAARITLRQTSPVTLRIHDVRGSVVRELRSGTLDAGTHDLRLDASGLTPGVYSLRISDERTSAVQRIVVVR